ncbi:DinB family protein [Ekhidna sp.]
MQFDLNKSLEILERTPVVIKGLLSGISTDWTSSNEGENTWSPFDIVGHLVHGEEVDWLPRTKIILQHGNSQPFEPFDRFAQFEKSKGKSLNQLLDEFEQLRTANLKELRVLNIMDDDLSKTGMHPGLGKITLQNLLSSWTVHDLGHIVQISRVLAKQYTSEVGPWTQYMAVLK